MNDLLLLTYIRAETNKDPELEIGNTGDFLEDLRQDWGNYLRRHLRDVKDQINMPLENDNKDEEIFIGTKDYPLKIQFKTYKGKKYIDIS